MKIYQNSIITLEKGDYYIKTLKVESGSKIVIDGGPAQIFIKDELTLNTCEVNLGGNPDLVKFYAKLNSDSLISQCNGSFKLSGYSKVAVANSKINGQIAGDRVDVTTSEVIAGGAGNGSAIEPVYWEEF